MSRHREKYLPLITRVFRDVLGKLAQREEPTLKIPKRTLSSVEYRRELGYLVLKGDYIERRMLDVGEARRFMQTLLVLSVIKQAIEEGDYPTIRDIYYSVKHTITWRDHTGRTHREDTFEEQRESDTVIEDIEVMLGVLREQLGITFDAKGRASGRVIIKSGRDTIDLSRMGTGAWAIPPNIDDIEIKRVDAKFVLVVEKGAIFERLNAERVWEKYNCVIVTGKGQPDRGTRRFVRRLHDEFGLPVFVMVDADPFGYYIYSVYAHGSIKLAYESARLAVPDAKLLGVWVSDIYRYRIPRRYIIKATDADIKRAKELLRYPWFANDRRWRQELELFLKKKEKIEIEAFSGFGFKYLSESYIPSKLKEYGIKLG